MKNESTLENILDSYDWASAIEVACRDGINPVIGSNTRTNPFTVTDIAKVFGCVNGENDESHWIAIVQLHDGRFVAIRAWCDYTGWG